MNEKDNLFTRPSNWLSTIGRFYDNSISDDPAEQAAAAEQLQAWRQQFEAATGYDLTDEIEQLPGKLKEAAESDHKANLRNSADAINQFIEQLKAATEESDGDGS